MQKFPTKICKFDEYEIIKNEKFIQGFKRIKKKVEDQIISIHHTRLFKYFKSNHINF